MLPIVVSSFTISTQNTQLAEERKKRGNKSPLSRQDGFELAIEKEVANDVDQMRAIWNREEIQGLVNSFSGDKNCDQMMFWYMKKCAVITGVFGAPFYLKIVDFMKFLIWI